MDTLKVYSSTTVNLLYGCRDVYEAEARITGWFREMKAEHWTVTRDLRYVGDFDLVCWRALKP